MNIVTNFDLLDESYFANKPVNPLKCFKYIFKKNTFYKVWLGGYIVYSCFSMDSIGKAIGSNLLGAGIGATVVSLVASACKIDPYKEEAETKLAGLSSALKQLDIDTNKDLLKECKSDGRVYNLKLNKNKIPHIVESKYILVPSYDNTGIVQEVKETGLVQEHVLGTKTYVLSKGRNQKQKKLVPQYSQM